MVETMVRRSSSTQAMPACFAATPTASPQGPAPMTSRLTDSVFTLPRHSCSGHLDNLIAPGSHAYVANRNPRELLQTVEVRPGSCREIRQPPGGSGRLLPPLECLIDRLPPPQCISFRRHFLAGLAVQP